MEDYATTTDEHYLQFRMDGHKDKEPLPNTPLSRLYYSQTVLASRIVAFDGRDFTTVHVEPEKLLGWFLRASKKENADEDVPWGIRNVVLDYCDVKGGDAGRLSVARKNE